MAAGLALIICAFIVDGDARQVAALTSGTLLLLAGALSPRMAGTFKAGSLEGNMTPLEEVAGVAAETAREATEKFRGDDDQPERVAAAVQFSTDELLRTIDRWRAYLTPEAREREWNFLLESARHHVVDDAVERARVVELPSTTLYDHLKTRSVPNVGDDA
jgi:hypothetical protein